MRTFHGFMFHKFTIRQSVLIIGAAVAVAFAANQFSQAAGLSSSAVTGVSVTAAVATFLPLQILFYRRAHA
jgi:NADPH:quinone reductase-like Zn-dependent oxidoreductase